MAAQIERRSGAYEEAATYLKVCRQLEGGLTPRTQLETLLLRAENGEVDEVGDGLLYTADHETANERSILEAMAVGNMRMMHFVVALNLLDRCLQRYPDDVRALDWHGWLLEQGDRQEGAIADYRRALELAPWRAEVRLRLARLYLNGNDPLQADLELAELRKAHPDSPEILLELGKCRFLQGHHDEARGLLERVLAVQPEQPSALLFLGKLELQSNPPRPVEAEDLFRRALKVWPNDSGTHNALFDSLRAQPGREAEATVELMKFNEIVAINHRIQDILFNEVDQSSTNPEPAYELGKLNLDLGNDEIALHWLKDTALKRDPLHKPTHALLADYYEKKGEKTEAAQERILAGGK